MTSKYLNRSFNGWKVKEATKTETGHTTFTLAKKLGGRNVTITVSDNNMTALDRGQSMESLLVNKVNAKR